MAWFSNFDPTGPVVTTMDIEHFNHNYEVKAPGVGILIHFKWYHTINGIMATPLFLQSSLKTIEPLFK